MARKGGNPNLHGNKNSGRKTIKQEVEEAKELITQDALIALANSKVYKQLKEIEEKKEGFIPTKEMALPITLKGMTERKDMTITLPVPLLKGIIDVHSDSSALQAPKAE